MVRFAKARRVEAVGAGSGVRSKPLQHLLDTLATYPETLGATHEQHTSVSDRFARCQEPFDGERQLVHAQITSLPWTDKAAIAGGIAVAAIAVALALGVAAIAVLMALVLVLLLAVALPLLLGSAVLLVLLSPLWLLAWLLWRTAVAPRRSGTMTA